MLRAGVMWNHWPVCGMTSSKNLRICVLRHISFLQGSSKPLPYQGMVTRIPTFLLQSKQLGEKSPLQPLPGSSVLSDSICSSFHDLEHESLMYKRGRSGFVLFVLPSAVYMKPERVIPEEDWGKGHVHTGLLTLEVQTSSGIGDVANSQLSDVDWGCVEWLSAHRFNTEFYLEYGLESY